VSGYTTDYDAGYPYACRCGHGPEQHGEQSDTPLCFAHGDNTHCNYADDEEIAADRWDEGWIAAVAVLCPAGLNGDERMLWMLANMPQDNPYRPDAARSTPPGEGQS